MQDRLRSRQAQPDRGTPGTLGAEGVGTVQAEQTAAEVDGNVMAVTGNGRRMDAAAVTRLQQRLIEVGSLTGTDYPNGELDGTTREAIEHFQSSHGEDIRRIQNDSLWMRREDRERRRSSGANPPDANQGVQSRRGQVSANDATMQALANAWPRTFFGVQLATEAQGYDFVEGLVRHRGLPFDADRVNVVGLRGFQGGAVHDNQGVRRRNNTYNDTFFVLSMEDNEKSMEEFKGTTDPGGRSGSNRQDDVNTHQLAEDQQFAYRLNMADRGKVGRPTFAPLVGSEGQGDVLDPGRAGMTDDQFGRVPDRRTGLVPAEGPQDDGSPRYDSLRTRHRGRSQRMTRGIAMHSGGRGEDVTSYSTGCQVVHGSWYGNFMQTVRRGVTPGAQHGAEDEGPLSDRGEVLYTILNGADFGSEGQRIALAAGGTLVDEPVEASAAL